jgi:hypothetical protein
MCILPVIAGLDYHEEFVQVCILDTDGTMLANRQQPKRQLYHVMKTPPTELASAGHPAGVSLASCQRPGASLPAPGPR